MLFSLNNVIIIIMNTYFPELSLVLTSMFFHFEPDNDFAVVCTRNLSYQCLLETHLFVAINCELFSQTREDKFCISTQPCNVLYINSSYAMVLSGIP
jgi:hypothetical protein